MIVGRCSVDPKVSISRCKGQVRPCFDQFDAADTAKKGQIHYAAFKALIAQLLGKDDERTATTIGKDEFKVFVVAALRKDTESPPKLVFQAFDTDRSRGIDVKERKSINSGIEATIEQITGTKAKKLNYAQVVKLLSGKNIEDDKLKSECCLLL
jgi:Ca2+-binding EF-hand superfamily protein